MAELVVITGPSGVGKGTLIRRLVQAVPGVAVSTSATTRAPRDGERDGFDYHFLSREEFDRRVGSGDFLEWAEYAGNRYGTLVSEVDFRSDDARVVILEIEVDGAEQVRAKRNDALLVFISPPSPDVLEERLRSRATDSDEQIARRLAEASRELAAVDGFDTVIVNDDLDEATQRLVEVVESRLH